MYKVLSQLRQVVVVLCDTHRVSIEVLVHFSGVHDTILLVVFKGLEKAHGCYVAHLDINSEQIYVEQQGQHLRAVLGDWGQAWGFRMGEMCRPTLD